MLDRWWVGLGSLNCGRGAVALRLGHLLFGGIHRGVLGNLLLRGARGLLRGLLDLGLVHGLLFRCLSLLWRLLRHLLRLMHGSWFLSRNRLHRSMLLLDRWSRLMHGYGLLVLRLFNRWLRRTAEPAAERPTSTTERPLSGSLLDGHLRHDRVRWVGHDRRRVGISQWRTCNECRRSAACEQGLLHRFSFCRIGHCSTLDWAKNAMGFARCGGVVSERTAAYVSTAASSSARLAVR